MRQRRCGTSSGIAVSLSKAFGLDSKGRKMLTVCGMSALFSAVFGTPFAAAVFAVEVTCLKSKDLLRSCQWLLPCLVSSLISWGISSFFGTNAERFHIDALPSFDIGVLLRTLAVALACAAVAYIFYKGLHLSEHMALKLIKNGYLRIFLGGALVAALTLFSGTTAFNGGGIEVIDSIFHGEEAPFMGFLYKMVFTVISVASGFKGGEIVPTLFVGASLGSVLSGPCGLPPEFASAIGMTGLFAGMTKCPLASLIISLEMFGPEGGVYFLIAVLVCTFLSGKGSLYIKNKH
ncbi:MAG: chloride channel protein [Clostridia bacterium]|nr:chloride channel protein [Clostridia bacterium]